MKIGFVLIRQAPGFLAKPQIVGEFRTVEAAYLGDSVYGAFDGEYIWLTTENGYSDDPQNRIAIEQGVYNNLVDFAAKVWNMKQSGKVEP